MVRLLTCIASLWLFVSVALADLTVGTLNCYFLFDPSKPEKAQLADRGPTKEQYPQKIENLSTLVKGLDVIAFQEIGGASEAGDLGGKAGGYRVCFVQGRDSYTGQDVATLVREDSRIKVVSAQRNAKLENLSKHLVVLLTEDSIRYAILNVHLLRPIGQNKGKHAAQVEAIKAWIEATRANSPTTVIVVLGDFNEPGRGLLPLSESGELTDHAPTHLANQEYDHIFTSGKLKAAEVVRPPYPSRPNDGLKMVWTDHYLLTGVISAEAP